MSSIPVALCHQLPPHWHFEMIDLVYSLTQSVSTSLMVSLAMVKKWLLKVSAVTAGPSECTLELGDQSVSKI